MTWNRVNAGIYAGLLQNHTNFLQAGEVGAMRKENKERRCEKKEIVDHGSRVGRDPPADCRGLYAGAAVSPCYATGRGMRRGMSVPPAPGGLLHLETNRRRLAPRFFGVAVKLFPALSRPTARFYGRSGKNITAGQAPLCPWVSHGQNDLWKPLKARKLL